MPLYFETVKSFADVPISDDGVETVSFLEASDGLVNMFDLLGVGVFSFVQTDLRHNIAGLRKRRESAPDRSATLERLVLAESEDGQSHARACLGRLLRGLAFTLLSLRNTQQDASKPLHACFRSAYDSTLKPHHGWAVQKIVYVALRAVPHRPDFYARISESSPNAVEAHQKLDAEMTKWLQGLDTIVRHMKTFLESRQMGKVTMP